MTGEKLRREKRMALKDRSPAAQPISGRRVLLLIIGAVGCFELAYLPSAPFPLQLFIVGYLICLMQLSRLGSWRKSYYAGLTVGFLCAMLQLDCFRTIFGIGAVALWYVLAFWIGLFVALLHATRARFGNVAAALLAPFLWTGLEYF